MAAPKIRCGPLTARNPTPPTTAAAFAGLRLILAGMSTAARERGLHDLQLGGHVGSRRDHPIPGGIRFCSHSSVSLLVSMVWVGVKRALSASMSMPVRLTSIAIRAIHVM